MIIYIVGFGRSGSTALAKAIEEKLNAVNLGEVKYLYRDDKDDLLHPYWLSFKQQHKDLLYNSSFRFLKYDSIMGLSLGNKKYCENWNKIFDRMELDPEEDIIIDSSKTPLDSILRGIRLKKCYKKVLYVQPKRNLLDIITSLLKGKNSNIERGYRKSQFCRLLHTAFISLPHLLITYILTRIYAFHDLETIDIDNLENDLNIFLKKHDLQRQKRSPSLPMIYGNRSRKV